MALRRDTLPLVRESQARGRIREVFAGLRHAFGTRHLDEVFAAYAATPLFLEAVWDSLRDAVASAQVAALSERLCALAYTATFNYCPVADLGAGLGKMLRKDGESHELTQLIEWLQFHDARLLLLTSAIVQAMERPMQAKPSDGKADTEASATASQRPPESLVLIDEAEASPALSHTLLDIRRAHGLPFLPSEYLALARWPDYLNPYWQALSPVLSTPLYHECEQELRMEAATMARNVPASLDLTVGTLLQRGLTQEEIAGAGRVSEIFAQVYSRLTLNTALARISLEGGNRVAPQKPSTSDQERRVA